MFEDFEQDALFTPDQLLENRGRVAIFIDGSNLFYAALQLGIEIDYTKLLHCLTGGSRLLRAFFYTGVDRSNEKQQGFLLWMRRNGYRVIAKDLVQLPDGSKKANLDVEIAVDLMSLVGSYDTAVVVSGDGDLAYAADAVSYRGARIEVVSLRSMTSDSLINVSDRYVDLDSIKEEFKNNPAPTVAIATSTPCPFFPKKNLLKGQYPVVVDTAECL
ncbi:LabA-like NYN domain-containing protein [Synechocystis salina]|nr:NYN domain-containing protein [Synechocystis salina]